MMKFIAIALTIFLFSCKFLQATESSCVLEFKDAYKNLFSSLMDVKDSQHGKYLIVEAEKYYRNGRKTERDTITYILSPPKRVKMYSKNFVLYSDGNIYIIVLPRLKKIAIQKISKKNTGITNPIEVIKEVAGIIISDKNFENCTEFTDNKNRNCKEIILRSPLGNNKYSAVENIHYLMDISNRSLIGAAIRYRNIVELREEKYIFSDVNTNYPLPWDMKCVLDEVVFEDKNSLKNEYKNYKLIDMRKQKQVLNLDLTKKKK